MSDGSSSIHSVLICLVFSGFAIEGPSQAKIECEDKNDGSCDVRYWPTEAGEYAVHVTCDEEDIEHSPFMAHIVPDDNTNHPEKVGETSVQRAFRSASSEQTALLSTNMGY